MIRRVETYLRFRNHINAWVAREVECLLVLGGPGLGKSTSYRTCLGNRPYHCFCGRQSALHIYNTLYDQPTLPVILDDVAYLLQDANFREMLKSLCESGARRVHWGTTTDKLDGGSVARDGREVHHGD